LRITPRDPRKDSADNKNQKLQYIDKTPKVVLNFEPQLSDHPNNSLLEKRERQLENSESETKSSVDLEIEEIENSTLKKKIKNESSESVKTADSVTCPDTSSHHCESEIIFPKNQQNLQKFSEAYSNLKEKVNEMEKKMSEETREKMQTVMEGKLKLSIKERFANVMNFFQKFDLNKKIQL